MKRIQTILRMQAFVLAVIGLLPGVVVPPADAAEIVGRITLMQQGQSLAAQQSGRIGIALFPLEGQPVPARAPREFTLEVRDLRLTPSYIVAHPGDTVRFINRDTDFFKLFSPSEDQPFEILLGPAGRDNEATMDLAQVDTIHVFCRIHAGTYGRIDVVDTPLTRMISAGESFEFRQLQAGRWKLRVSAPGAEIRELEVQAITAPPSIQINLESLVLANSSSAVLQEPVVVEQLFPSEPGF